MMKNCPGQRAAGDIRDVQKNNMEILSKYSHDHRPIVDYSRLL